MNVSAIKAAVRYLGCWCAMVFFVVLLTTIFSFLGTIICAVLAGMMMGAAKHRRWQAIPVAIVFPAVIFTMLRSTKAELLGRQVVVLSLLCFGAFWLTYLVTSLLLVFESKKPVDGPDDGAALKQSSSAVHQDTLRPSTEVGRSAPAPLTLADLQGGWRQAVATRNGDSPERRLEITGDRLRLSVVDGDGRAREVREATLNVSGPSCVGSGRTADPKLEPGTRVGEPGLSHRSPGAPAEQEV